MQIAHGQIFNSYFRQFVIGQAVIIKIPMQRESSEGKLYPHILRMPPSPIMLSHMFRNFRLFQRFEHNTYKQQSFRFLSKDQSNVTQIKSFKFCLQNFTEESDCFLIWSIPPDQRQFPQIMAGHFAEISEENHQLLMSAFYF